LKKTKGMENFTNISMPFMEFTFNDHKIQVWFVSEYEFIWEVE